MGFAPSPRGGFALFASARMRPRAPLYSLHHTSVLAALFLPYSQGQTKVRVNKVKLVKRSMYGRGKLDLLRQRVLYAAS